MKIIGYAVLLLLISCPLFASNPVLSSTAETVVPYRLSEQEKKDGYRLLFDGTTLDGWINNTDEYILENGCIAKKASGFGNLYSEDSFCNFVLKFEFQLTPGANNGLGLRHIIVPEGYLGMELQILDNDDPQYKDLKPYQYHGGLYNYAPAKRGYLKPVGEWNQQEVIARGANIKIILNGTVILDTNIKKVIKDIPYDKVQSGLRNSCGHIAFLGHDSVVRFRYIRIKVLE